MLPLIVLIVATSIALFGFKTIRARFQVALSARIGMSVMLFFTAMGHFLYTDGMTAMIPDFIPFKSAVVYLTGAIEILAAIGLQFPKHQRLTGWLLILFFTLILPANIKAALDHLNYQSGTLDGPGLEYLWFRIPLQVLFIVWVYFSCIRPAER
jgi:uncharacterized membrane protein